MGYFDRVVPQDLAHGQIWNAVLVSALANRSTLQWRIDRASLEDPGSGSASASLRRAPMDGARLVFGVIEHGAFGPTWEVDLEGSVDGSTWHVLQTFPPPGSVVYQTADLCFPYNRLTVRNTDGVNDGTFTLAAIVLPGSAGGAVAV